MKELVQLPTLLIKPVLTQPVLQLLDSRNNRAKTFCTLNEVSVQGSHKLSRWGLKQTIQVIQLFQKSHQVYLTQIIKTYQLHVYLDKSIKITSSKTSAKRRTYFFLPYKSNIVSFLLCLSHRLHLLTLLVIAMKMLACKAVVEILFVGRCHVEREPQTRGGHLGVP